MKDPKVRALEYGARLIENDLRDNAEVFSKAELEAIEELVDELDRRAERAEKIAARQR